jgi:hypothetical protein
MKRLVLGMVIGSIITCGVFYFFVLDNDRNQEKGVAELVELLRQQHAAKSKVQEALESNNATLAGSSPLTIIVTPGTSYYHYRDIDCGKIKKADTAEVHALLGLETQNRKAADVRIIIKMYPGATYKNAIGLLDAIARSGIQPGHYAEMDLTEKEINCIKSYK